MSDIHYENYVIMCCFDDVCPYCGVDVIMVVKGGLPFMRCKVCYKIFWRDSEIFGLGDVVDVLGGGGK